MPLPARMLAIAAFALLSASPALAVDEYGLPTGASPEEAKVPVGKEFDPAAQNLNIPAPDPRFTNNPALNNLIAPEEQTAPPLAEQDMQKWEEDFTNPLSPEEKAEALKEQAREERRNINKMINPSKARSLAPEPAEDEAAEEEMETDLSALPAFQDEPLEPDMGLENAGIELLEPLTDPEDSAVKERSSEAEYGIVKTDKGARYKRPETGTSKSGKDAPEASEEKSEEKEEEKTEEKLASAETPASTPAAPAAEDTAEEEPAAEDEPAAEEDIEEATPRGRAVMRAKPVTAISESRGRVGGKPAKKAAAKSSKKGSSSSGGKSSGKAGGKSGGKPGEPRPEKITPEERAVEKLFEKLND